MVLEAATSDPFTLVLTVAAGIIILIVVAGLLEGILSMFGGGRGRGGGGTSSGASPSLTVGFDPSDPSPGISSDDLEMEVQAADNSGSGLKELDIVFNGSSMSSSVSGSNLAKDIPITNIIGGTTSLSAGDYDYMVEVEDNNGDTADATGTLTISSSGGGGGSTSNPPLINTGFKPPNPSDGESTDNIDIEVDIQDRSGNGLDALKIAFMGASNSMSLSGSSFTDAIDLTSVIGSSTNLSTGKYPAKVEVTDNDGNKADTKGQLIVGSPGSSPGDSSGGGSGGSGGSGGAGGKGGSATADGGDATSNPTAHGGDATASPEAHGGAGGAGGDATANPKVNPEINPTVEGAEAHGGEGGNASTGDVSQNVNMDSLGKAMDAFADVHGNLIDAIIDGEIAGDVDSSDSGRTELAATVQPFPVTADLTTDQLVMKVEGKSQSRIEKLVISINGTTESRVYNNHSFDEQVVFSDIVGNQEVQEGEVWSFGAELITRDERANIVDQFEVRPRSNKNQPNGNGYVTMKNQQLSEVEKNMDASIKREIEELEQEYENLTAMVEDTDHLERIESALTNDVEEVVNHLKKARQWEHKLNQHQNGRLENDQVQEQIKHDLDEVQSQINKADRALKQFKKDSREMKNIMKELTTESQEFNNLTRKISEQEEKLDQLDNNLNQTMNQLMDAGINID